MLLLQGCNFRMLECEVRAELGTHTPRACTLTYDYIMDDLNCLEEGR